MKDKFTSGPWINEDYSFEITSKECCLPIAKVTVFNEGKANAHLIAAAPDMYKALKSMVDMMDCGDESGDGSEWHAEAVLALKKARGVDNT